METAERELTQCVKVAVNVRPLTTTELANGSTDCITVVPGEPQVQIGTHAFTFDHVYGRSGSPSSSIFDECVAPLVEGIFNGYNATVLAYGQTGSGKTYTMGTVYTGEANNNGIIPRVMEMIFSKVDSMKDHIKFLIRVSFIEIFKEEVFDLLDQNTPNCSKGKGLFVAKPSIPSKVPIQIRETLNKGITLVGVNEAEVRTKEEMASLLFRGCLSRAVGSTNINSQSSRSHAIFTIYIEQKKNTTDTNTSVNSDDMADDILCAKLHLVDLGGSERAKQTGTDGLRLIEAININKGLLALGNVIHALGDEKKRKEGAHVPYRNSKLTRLLEDSLGGNSRTVMIACVSPADTNAKETLNTLKYANHARNIRNKAIINRDLGPAQMQRLQNKLKQLQAENDNLLRKLESARNASGEESEKQEQKELKKGGRRNEAEMHKPSASNRRQESVQPPCTCSRKSTCITSKCTCHSAGIECCRECDCLQKKCKNRAGRTKTVQPPCTCSRKSTCITSKCTCHSANIECCRDCSCLPKKCKNWKD